LPSPAEEGHFFLTFCKAIFGMILTSGLIATLWQNIAVGEYSSPFALLPNTKTHIFI
jgi:hypothetical protein